MNKRGMSGVITMFLIILLMLVAVGVIWVVVKNVVVDKSDQIGLDRFTSDLQIERVLLSEDDIKVVVKRGIGDGELTKINFVIDDGVNSESFEIESDLGELEISEFTLVPVELVVGNIKNIKIVSVYSSASGGEVFGEVSDSFNTENLEVEVGEEGEGNDGEGEGGECDPACDSLHTCDGGICIFDNSNLILWWNFDGDAVDEIEGLVGTVEGATLVEGHFDQAYDFDGDEDRIIVSSDSIFNGISLPATMSFWIKPVNVDDNQRLFYRQNWIEVKLNNEDLEFKWKNDAGGDLKPKIQDLGDYENQWIHIVSTISSTQAKIYLNGVFVNSDTENNFEFKQPTGENLYIGTKENGNYEYEGGMDEIMIFNKALSDEEVLLLYNI